MLLLVDGYNVTMRDPATAGPLEGGPARGPAGPRFVCTRASLRPGGTVVVVFDAHGALGRSSDADGAVKAVYASVADDEIVRRCSGATGSVWSSCTDDLRMRARISQDVGRHVEYRDSSSVFAENLAEASRASKRTPVARDAGLPPGREQDHRGTEGPVACRGRLRGLHL